MEQAFRAVGIAFLTFLRDVGGTFILLGRIIRSAGELPRTIRQTLIQMEQIGLGSIPLVIVTSIFIGAVAAVQAAYQFQDYVPMRFLGTVVGKSVILELGPVLTALVVGGRVSASIAAELGTMKVTEQRFSHARWSRRRGQVDDACSRLQLPSHSGYELFSRNSAVQNHILPRNINAGSIRVRKMMIECQNLWKSFCNKSVLKGADISVERGKTLVVIGQSGCGKSVLLKHFVGLLMPDRGKVFVDGEDITRMKRKNIFRIRMRFGMVFQGSALFDSLTVGENVCLALKEHTDKTEEVIKATGLEKLSLVGLEDVIDKKPAELSGGMKKRVGIARAIAMDPECVFYDEPTTGLDPIMADVINNLIIKLKHELSITSVIVTHDIQSAYKVGDEIAMLHGGRIIFAGTPDEVQNSSNELIRQFIAGSAEGPISTS